MYSDFLHSQGLSWERVEQQPVFSIGIRGTGRLTHAAPFDASRPVLAAMLMAEQPPEPAPQADVVQASHQASAATRPNGSSPPGPGCANWTSVSANWARSGSSTAGQEVLDTRVGVGDIARAMTEPPPGHPRAGSGSASCDALPGRLQWDRFSTSANCWLDPASLRSKREWSYRCRGRGRVRTAHPPRQLRDPHELYREGNRRGHVAKSAHHQHRLSPNSLGPPAQS